MNTKARHLSTTALLRPFQEFVRLESLSALLLLGAAAAAIIWANSPAAESYHRLWRTEVAVGAGELALAKPLLLWVNEGLMALFFFVVGLEIKREVLAGELASRGTATLPFAAAVGGMLAPALVYLALTAGRPTANGWGVPMATDIAFALGVLALLGRRIPAALRVLLAALAIVDDLGAVLVIAVAYAGELSWPHLGAAAALFGLLVVANRGGVRHPLVYGLVGAAVWLALLGSGVHATVAGVLVALTVPARGRIGAGEFVDRTQEVLQEFAEAGPSAPEELMNPDHLAALHKVQDLCAYVNTPLQRLEHALTPWVAWLIVPLFALANAGVRFGVGLEQVVTEAVGIGVLLGLCLGKPLGITLFSWLAVRAGLARLPAGVSWRHIYGVACLGGIGFTMAIFIATLAFADEGTLQLAKTAVLAASLLSGVAGWLILRRAPAGT